MRWFQPIECDKTVKKPLVCDYSNFDEYGYDEDYFISGELINNWNTNIYMQAKKKKYDGLPDDVLQNAFMIPIFSEGLVKQLNQANIKGIQYLPILILGFNKKCIDGFSIANLINYVEAFDYEKSKFSIFDEDFPNVNMRGKIAGVSKFVLKKSKLDGFDIIRLKEYNPRFFVSEKFKNVFEKNRFTGYSFKEVQLSD